MDIFSKDFEKRYGYDRSIDYIKEGRLFNKYLKEGNRCCIDALLRKHGGIIALQAKISYQIEKEKEG